MTLLYKATPLLLVTTLALIGCSGSSMSGVEATVGIQGGPDSKGQSSDADSEKSKANAPQQVSGSFLTCAYIGTEAEVAAASKAGKPIEFGCGLYRKSTGSVAITDISGLSVGTSLRCSNGGAQKASAAPLPRSSKLQFKVQANTEQLPCAIAMVLNGTDRKPIAFARSIPTITQVDAEHGFSVNQDIQDSGLVFNADGSPRFPATPNVSLFDRILSKLDSAIQVLLIKGVKAATLIVGGTASLPESAEVLTPVQSDAPSFRAPAGGNATSAKTPSTITTPKPTAVPESSAPSGSSKPTGSANGASTPPPSESVPTSSSMPGTSNVPSPSTPGPMSAPGN
jgi:hypothetical protein